jgi:hypothetical protein
MGKKRLIPVPLYRMTQILLLKPLHFLRIEAWAPLVYVKLGWFSSITVEGR